MAKPDTSAFKTFDQIASRLDEIVGQVRDKETSLERSLDLFDEAIALGSKAVDLVDAPDFTPEEEARLRTAQDAVSSETPSDETSAGTTDDAPVDAPLED